MTEETIKLPSEPRLADIIAALHVVRDCLLYSQIYELKHDMCAGQHALLAANQLDSAICHVRIAKMQTQAGDSK